MEPEAKFKQPNSNPAVLIIFGVLVAAVVFGGIYYYQTKRNSPTNPSGGGNSPQQAVLNSTKQYYSPANASSYNILEQTAVANACMGSSYIVGFPTSSQVRYCGCALATVEQNYTPGQIENLDSITYAELQTETQNAITQYCGSLL